MKKVSVVVPCYNAAEYLDKCIEHLLHQTIGLANMEIILVNDASTDEGETWGLITEYEKQYPDTIIAVNLDENLRQGGARNVGISYASGEYLIFCDADDWLLYETLEHCYCKAVEYDADVVEFLMRNVDSRELVVPLERCGEDYLIEADTQSDKQLFLLYVTEQITMGSQKKLFRMSLIRENHIAFAEHLIFEEPSFVVPVRIYESRHYFLNEQLYICYQSQGSTVRSEWEKTHRWDNPKVWMHLMEDILSRDEFEEYYSELGYLFFSWGIRLSLRMLLDKGCIVTKEELQFLVNMVLTLFPDIRQNKYIKVDDSPGNAVLLSLFDVEITDQVAKDTNDALRRFFGVSQKKGI